MVLVPYARAATAWAPPIQYIFFIPQIFAAYNTEELIAVLVIGVTMVISSTPATTAGIVFIITVLG